MTSQWNKGDIFHLTYEHIMLLTRAYVGWNDMETGAPSIEPKRPYGDSNVPANIFEILGWSRSDPEGDLTKEEFARANKLHRETRTALEIILGCQTFSTGKYRYVADRYYRAKWEYIPDEDPVY